MDEDNRITEHAEDEHFVVKMDMDPRTVRPYDEHFIHTIISPAAEAAKEVRVEAVKKGKIWLPNFYYVILGSKRFGSEVKRLALARIRKKAKDNLWLTPVDDWKDSSPAQQLNCAFYWEDTNEGYHFWSTICNELIAMREKH